MTESTTRKYIVSFGVSVTTTEKDEAAIEAAMLEVAKMAYDEVELEDDQREMLVQYMTRGVSGVVHYAVCSSMGEAIGEIKNEHEDSFEFSTVTIKEVE